MIEHVVVGGQTRPAFGGTIADLLNNLALFLFGSFQVPGNALALVGFILDGRCEVAARLCGDVVEYAHAEECGGQAGQNPILQVLAQDGLLVGAAGAAEPVDWQLVLVVGAAVAFLGHDGVGATALGALQHSAQQVARPMRPVQPIGGCPGKVLERRQLPFFYARPEFVADDAHGRHFRHNPFAFVVEAGGAPFGLRVLAVILLVPDDSADIEFVVEDVGLPLAVTTDRVVAPVLVLGCRDMARIEALGDCCRADAICILLEDPAHDLGLGRFDLAQALDPVAVGVALLAEAVAVGKARGCDALARRCLHAFSRAVADLLDQFMAECGAHMQLDMTDLLAGLNRPDRRVVVVEFLEDF
ncbi:hypothetical protein BCY90_26220 [Agrobacterium deltaense]|nr:hypothetical protein BCY90_26220 [Agrobacterium deltaense]